MIKPKFSAMAAGLGLAISSSNAPTIAAGNVTDTLAPDFFFDDAATGGGDDVTIGTATDAFTFAGAASEYAWVFDTAMSATIDGLNNFFRIVITPTNGTSNGSLSFKSTVNNPGATAATAATVKLSVAGTSVAAVPEPSAALLGGTGLLLLARRRR